MSSDATAASPAWQHDPTVFSSFTADLAVGDDAAWQSLFDECYQRLVRLAGQKAGSQLPSGDWEDPACEAIERLADALQTDPKKFKAAPEMFAWLATVTRRRTVEAIRRRSGRAQRYQLVPIPVEGSGAITPEALVQRVQADVDGVESPLEQQLRALLQKLSVRDQEILLKTATDDALAKRYNLTTQQVADIRYKRTCTLKRQVAAGEKGGTTL